MNEAYVICWDAKGYFGRGTMRLDKGTAERECIRLNQTYPHIRHWAEAAPPDVTEAPLMPDGPPPSMVARLYHAYAVGDMRSFEAVCTDLSIEDMRLLARRLQRMSSEVRMLIDVRTAKEHAE